ncbi:MAG: hypothetical protein IT162_06430 [Bryobacterales bacterium]|nr:hypothetical protein [Bryobacterales bacterium]
MLLKIWINAFIPFEVRGYTRRITTGTHRGKTAVPLPGLARMNPGNWKDWDAGYLTDQRQFDSSLTAGVRMRSLAELEVSADAPQVTVVKTSHETSGTTEVDIETGEELGFEKANMSRCAFEEIIFKPAADGLAAHYSLGLDAAASDPLVSTAADIDYRGKFLIIADASGQGCSVAFVGYIDAFPAFECYARFNGYTQVVFTAMPPPGNTVLDLPGLATRLISGTAVF